MATLSPESGYSPGGSEPADRLDREQSAAPSVRDRAKQFVSARIAPTPVRPTAEEMELPGRRHYYSWYDSAEYKRISARTIPFRTGAWLFSILAVAMYPARAIIGFPAPAAAILAAIACAIVAVSLGVTSSIMTLNAVARYRQAIAAGELCTAINEVEDFTDLHNLLKLNRKSMESYQNISIRQATTSFRMAQAAMVIGLLVLAAGIVLSLSTPNTIAKIASAGLASVGVVLSGYISHTFIRLHESAMQRLYAYYEQPLINSYMLTAERLAGGLDDGRKSALVEAIIKQALARSGGSPIRLPHTPDTTRNRSPRQTSGDGGERMRLPQQGSRDAA